MKKLFIGLFVCLSLLRVGAAETGVEWQTDAVKALEQAKTEKKLVLLDFTGSDWCGWCIRLNKEVFSKQTFAEYAKENLVAVEVDFPQKKELSAEQSQANDALAEKYGVKGYPTIVVLNSDGKKIAQFGYQPGGAESFIAVLDKLKAKANGSTGLELKNRKI